jgi:hypothetical protein
LGRRRILRSADGLDLTGVEACLDGVFAPRDQGFSRSRVFALRALTKMSAEQKIPADIARGLAKRARTQVASSESAWRREAYTLERGAARVKARAYFAKFPKAAYMTEIESWRELSSGRIEFTIRRLPSAD